VHLSHTSHLSHKLSSCQSYSPGGHKTQVLWPAHQQAHLAAQGPQGGHRGPTAGRQGVKLELICVCVCVCVCVYVCVCVCMHTCRTWVVSNIKTSIMFTLSSFTIAKRRKVGTLTWRHDDAVRVPMPRHDDMTTQFKCLCLDMKTWRRSKSAYASTWRHDDRMHRHWNCSLHQMRGTSY